MRRLSLFLLVLAGCYSGPPAEDFTVRLEAQAQYALVQDGTVRIDGEDVDSTLIPGDDLDLSSDLELEPSFAYGAKLDVRPGNNSELRLRYLRFDRYEGSASLDENFVIGGQEFLADTEGRTEIAIDRVQLSYAHRLLALGYELPVRFDWLIRGGLEYNHVDLTLEGEVNAAPIDFDPTEFDGKVNGDLHIGSPFVGTDLRLAIGERVLLWAEASFGTIYFDSVEYTTYDFATGVRVRLVGPLDVGVFYELGVRQGKYDPKNEPGGEFDLLLQGVGVAVGLQF